MGDTCNKSPRFINFSQQLRYLYVDMNKTNNKPQYSKRITVRITDQSYRLLKQIRNTHDLPTAFFIRHVLEKSLEKVTQNLKKNFAANDQIN